MGIKERIKRITGSGNIKEGCQFDQTSGKFRCEKRRTSPDGTEEVLGVVSGQLDGECKPHLDEEWQVENGVIDSLKRKFVDNIRGKCKREDRPEDY